MCQGAHALEAVFVKKYIREGVLFWMLLGQLAPDLLTKVFIFSGDTTAWKAQKLPPLGLTHAPVSHLFVGLLIWVLIFNRENAPIKAISYIAGAWMHIIMDAGDPYGVMLLYPISENLFSWKDILGFELWAYGNEFSGAVDARMYFMSWGLLIEFFFLITVVPILPSMLARKNFTNPLEFVFIFTFVIYNASLFFILTLVPAILGVPVPESFNPVFSWGNANTFSGETPQAAVNAQWILGAVMGFAFLCSLTSATFLAIQYYPHNSWPKFLQNLITHISDIFPLLHQKRPSEPTQLQNK